MDLKKNDGSQRKYGFAEKKMMGIERCVDLTSYVFYIKEEKKIMGFQRCVDLTSYIIYM